MSSTDCAVTALIGLSLSVTVSAEACMLCWWSRSYDWTEVAMNCFLASSARRSIVSDRNSLSRMPISHFERSLGVFGVASNAG